MNIKQLPETAAVFVLYIFMWFNLVALLDIVGWLYKYGWSCDFILFYLIPNTFVKCKGGVMASYQRIALFVFFDAIERDLVSKLRSMVEADSDILNPDEREKAAQRMESVGRASDDDFDLFHGLDLGDKYNILMRNRFLLDEAGREYYLSKRQLFEKAVPIRNSTMHGRPLTTFDYSIGFSLARDFLASPSYWPELAETYKKYGENPDELMKVSIALWDDDGIPTCVSNNLPVPDYDDTGFLPRRELEKELKKKILGRHPVITVLGDGGDGKTAVTLQTLYGLLDSNDHDYDAFVWVSAKTNKLTQGEILRIEGAISTSLGIFQEVANSFEPGDESPLVRVRRLLEKSKVLLVIDNLETVLDDDLIEFASDVPGVSKIIFTSRVPLGGDLSVRVTPFSESEALAYYKRLVEAYDISALKKLPYEDVRKHLRRLAYKPLLIKWFALGVNSGLEPSRVTANPELALRFCMENVFNRLGKDSKDVVKVMVSIPRPISISVLSSISGIHSRKIESGISELARFGILESVDGEGGERLYRLKPFSKSYAARVAGMVPREAERYISNYRAISSVYQEELGASLRNKYSPKTYVVRNVSEAIAAKKLKLAFSQASAGDFDSAFGLIEDLKITNPDYFEVYRSMAFISYLQGDLIGAQAAYEAALELGSGQPQLHYFYGGFILRSSGDNGMARAEYEKALELDPEEPVVLRELARVSMFVYDFNSAQGYLSEVFRVGFKSFKDEVIANDLQAQIFCREADYLRQVGDYRLAVKSIERLDLFLKDIKSDVVDDVMRGHLRKVLPTIEQLVKWSSDDAGSLRVAMRLIKSIISGSSEDFELSGESALNRRVGILKKNGARENFVFIKGEDGSETYLSKSSVSLDVWHKILKGSRIEFSVDSDANGKSRVFDVVLI